MAPKKRNTPDKIPENTDFYRVFNREAEESENFEALFKASNSNRSLNRLMEEKKAGTPKNPHQNRRSLIKTYPKPQKTLDLHGLTEAEAVEAVNTFISGKSERGIKTLRIITGKGLHSKSEPVLRNSMEGVAIQLVRKGVLLSWTWENKIKEKSGAIILYLK